MSKHLRSSPARIATLLALCGGTAHAVDDLEFLKLVDPTGKAIAGESTATGHKGWTAIDDLSWKISAEASYIKGTSAAVGKPVASAIRWNQALDTTVPSMYQTIVKGAHLDSASFDYVRPDSAAGSPYFSLGLKTVYFKDLASNNGRISPAVVANEFALTYAPAALGKAGQPITATWDIARMVGADLPSIPPDAALVGTGRAAAAAAGGAVQGYLRLGNNIAGNSLAMGYENWIPVRTAGWDIFAETSYVAVGKAIAAPLTWTQEIDQTLLVALSKITSGTSLPKVTLELVKNAGAGPVTFMQMTMQDVFFTSVALDGPLVTESVVFKSVTELIWQVKDDGTRATTPMQFSWDIPSNTFTGPTPAAAVAGFGKGSLAPVVNVNIGAPDPGGIDLPAPALPVPEPQTWVLMLAGSALLLGVARRRRAG